MKTDSSAAPSPWLNCNLPSVRVEAHFGDRLVRSFEPRARRIHDLLAHTVLHRADDLALVCESQRLTWRELHAQVASVATGFQQAGILPGDRVALFQGNNPAFVIAFLAIQQLGAIAVAVGRRERPPRSPAPAGWRQARPGCGFLLAPSF